MKFLILFFLSFIFLPFASVSALDVKDNGFNFQRNQSYTLELIAKPKSSENVVKINLAISGGTIEDFIPINNEKLISVTSDCRNGKTFTEDSICTTLIKSEELEENETLGFVKINITEPEKLSLYKIAGNAYSSGVDIREDLGELLEIKKTSTNTQTSTVQILQSDQDPLLFYILIGVGIAILVLLISLIIFALRIKR